MVLDPEEAMLPGAPVVHAKDAEEARIARPLDNVVGESHGEIGSVEEGFAAAEVVYEETFRTQRVQHASLETHGAVAWFEQPEEGPERVVVRSSTQTPFLTRRALCALFDLPLEKVRVLAGRVGGGFGGKQEMIVEDIVVLAAMRLHRPVKLEYTRAEQFFGATTRHPFTVRVKAGARRDGSLTALQLRVVSNTGAYGNHGPAVMFHSVGESMAVYRAPHKKADAYAVYTHAVPHGRVPRLRARAGRLRHGVGHGRTGPAARHGPAGVPGTQHHRSGGTHDQSGRRGGGPAHRQLRARPVPGHRAGRPCR